MAAPDPLLLLRASVAASAPLALVPTDSLATATDLTFPPCPPTTDSPTTIPLNTATRFIKDSNPVDLRSIYFAWLQRDTPITEYIASAQALGDSGVTHLAFIERLELVTYIEGGQEDGDHIKPLPSSQADGSAPTAVSAPAKVPAGGSASLVGKVRTTDPRMLEIYSYERVIANRNTMLRGIKPTDFSHVRKQAEDFIARLRSQPKNGAPPPPPPPPPANRPGAPPPNPHQKFSRPIPGQPSPSKPSRMKDPIILLSPSASSLLTMSNIKPFLEGGQFVAPQQQGAGAVPQIHHVARLLPSINPAAPIRFVVVDSSDKFKPEYWERVVAVFTTGQEWQFRSYKWSDPVTLFREVRGFYVGWEGEGVPESVRRWGSGVTTFAVNRGLRFRDREICEKFWEGVESWMLNKGWGRT